MKKEDLLGPNRLENQDPFERGERPKLCGDRMTHWIGMLTYEALRVRVCRDTVRLTLKRHQTWSMGELRLRSGKEGKHQNAMEWEYSYPYPCVGGQ